MRFELDHFLVCTSIGAPEAEELIQFGLREGPPNTHPGQGTANRRFSFLNAMLELFWVHDPEEARSPATRRTQLWERWSERDRGSCPFGICVRPVDAADDEIPFPAWPYQPSYLPPPLAMHIGEAGISEPLWVFMGFMRRAQRESHFVEHPIGVREITGLTLTTPVPLESAVSQAMIQHGVISAKASRQHLLEVEFDRGTHSQIKDFRPHLPLLFRL